MTGLPLAPFPRHYALPATRQTLDQTELDILRSLGRFEFMTAHWVGMLHFWGKHRNTVHRSLTQLEKAGFVWRIRTDVFRGGLRGRSPYVYGLSKEGFEYLSWHDQEVDRAMLDRLKYRSRHGLTVGRATLLHDLRAAEWAVGMVHALRFSPRLEQIYVQVEYTTQDQRFDAFVLARLHKTPLAIRPNLMHIPWWDTNEQVGQPDLVAFALEVDRGTESPKIIQGKAEQYRDLALSGFYQRQFGTYAQPVFLVPDQARLLKISSIWAKAWGQVGKRESLRYSALISLLARNHHAVWGPLWGNYIHIMSKQPQYLLQPIGCLSVHDWEKAWLPVA